jgi:sugar (glycoside-pentoside-hexuronide) transporter
MGFITVMMAVLRVFDAANDPVMGTIVDKTRSKYGKCRPWLMIAPIPSALLVIACFALLTPHPDPEIHGNNIGMMVFVTVTYFLFMLVYTIGDIPLWGVTALMTESDKDRTKLLSLARMIAGIGAGAAILGFVPIAGAIGDGFFGNEYDPRGYLIAAAGFAVIGGALYQLAGFFIREKVAPTQKQYGVIENYKLLWKNKPFRQILLSGIFGSSRMLVMLAAMPLVMYYFAPGAPGGQFLIIALLGGGLFGGQFVSMAFIPRLLKKYSKKTLYNYGNLLGVIPNLLMFGFYMLFPTRLADPAFLMICVLLFAVAGAALGVPMVLQSIMIADCVDYEEYHNGVRPDGVFFAGQTFIAKMTAGVATILFAAASTIVGFSDTNIANLQASIDAGLPVREMAEFRPYMTMLFFVVTVLPAIGYFLAVIPTWKYALDTEVHKEIIDELNRRRHEGETDEVHVRMTRSMVDVSEQGSADE